MNVKSIGILKSDFPFFYSLMKGEMANDINFIPLYHYLSKFGIYLTDTLINNKINVPVM